MSTTATVVNTEMQAAWEEEGLGWAQHWERYDRAVVAHHSALLAAAAVRDGEHVLDVGCGNGQVARDLARRSPSGAALGVDLSPAMVERARELAAAEGVGNAAFACADAQVHPFERPFDVVTSRFGTMFFADRRAAFAHLAASTRPGGRLAMAVWAPRDDNAWLTTFLGALLGGPLPPAPPEQAPSPFSLSRADHVVEVLTAAGWAAVEVERLELPFWAGETAEDAFGFMSGTGVVLGTLGGLPEAERPAALERLRAAMEAHETPEGVLVGSTALLVTARRSGG